MTARLSRGLCTLATCHQRLQMSGTFSQGLCASDKRHHPMASAISQMILVVDFCIGRGLCTLLSQRPSLIGRINRGLCT